MIARDQRLSAPEEEGATEQSLPVPPEPPTPPAPDAEEECESPEEESDIFDDTATATEHSENTDLLSREKQLTYSIVNAFLDKNTFEHPEPQVLLTIALQDEELLPPSVRDNVEAVFSPIFFDYKNGLKDRSQWTARNANEYIQRWHAYAAMRERVRPTSAVTEHDFELT